MTALTETYVARWHSDEGHFVVLVCRDAKGLKLIVQGHPMAVVKVPGREEAHLQRLDYPVRKAARSMRKFAKHNSTGRVRKLLDEVLGKSP